jgi:hypothetical protein
MQKMMNWKHWIVSMMRFVNKKSNVLCPPIVFVIAKSTVHASGPFPCAEKTICNVQMCRGTNAAVHFRNLKFALLKLLCPWPISYRWYDFFQHDSLLDVVSPLSSHCKHICTKWVTYGNGLIKTSVMGKTGKWWRI